MPFFNTKYTALKAGSNNTDLVIGALVTVPFYIAEIYKDTPITTVRYQLIEKSGRDTKPLTSLTAALLDSDSMYLCDVTPDGTAGSTIYFKFEITDNDLHLYYLESSEFKLITTTVTP